jgi:hypothetical protein
MAGWLDGETASDIKRFSSVYAAIGSRPGNA